MSESESERGGIADEDLPEDLQPGEGNPLAEPLDTEEVDPHDLDLDGGKGAQHGYASSGGPDDTPQGEGDDGDDTP